MKKKPFPSSKTSDLSRLDTAQLLLLVEQMQQQIDAKDSLLLSKDSLIASKDKTIKDANNRILLLEEIIRLYKIQKFAASSEKSTFQLSLFDEAELEAELGDRLNDTPETPDESPELKQMRKERKPRNRAFSTSLPRKRIELLLSETEKQGASTTFFTKVKEELEYIPAQLSVLEYWQEKAVFEHADGSEQVRAAQRPVHPLGKCQASRVDTKKPAKGKQTLADQAVDLIRPLYRIEKELADASDAERLQKRQEQSLPHLQTIKAWLDDKQGKVMKDGKLHKAIQYSLNQWEYLTGYCQRGDLKISNALAENAIRPFAIGRKNWLFADTSKGAHASAAWHSLIETAKMHGLNPQTYLLHVLENIATAKTVEQL